MATTMVPGRGRQPHWLLVDGAAVAIVLVTAIGSLALAGSTGRGTPARATAAGTCPSPVATPITIDPESAEPTDASIPETESPAATDSPEEPCPSPSLPILADASPTPDETPTEPPATATPRPSATRTAFPGDRGEIDIWSSLPRQGPIKATTDSIVNAIRLAFQERDWQVAGWTINYTDLDDSLAEAGQWTPEEEIRNATDAARNDNLVAYLGPFNSGAARESIPVLCQAGIAMVSPSNTYPGLTVPGGGEAGDPERFYRTCLGGTRNYFRTSPPDDRQGTAAAEWALDLGARRVQVVDDSQIYGTVVAEAFRKRATELGLKVVGRDSIRGSEPDYRELAQQVRDRQPDLVFFGGITQQNAGQLWTDLRAHMPNVMLMGTDGILEQAFLDVSGPSAEGTYSMWLGLTPDRYTGRAAAFRDRYVAEYGAEPDEWAIYGYDAAGVVCEAIERAVRGGADDPLAIRGAVIDALRSTRDYEGALGRFSFDANGDTTLTMYAGVQVKDGEFEFVRIVRERSVSGP